jgi:hypothetical protein
MGWGLVGEMTQALYAHMNNKTIKKTSKTHIYALSRSDPNTCSEIRLVERKM